MEDQLRLTTESYDFDPTVPDVLTLDIADLREQEGLEYPAVLLSNVLFMDCLKVLQSVKRESYRQMQVWIELPDTGEFRCIGEMQIDSDVLLLLRHLKIQVTMYYDEENLEFLDLEDPETFERFL